MINGSTHIVGYISSSDMLLFCDNLQCVGIREALVSQRPTGHVATCDNYDLRWILSTHIANEMWWGPSCVLCCWSRTSRRRRVDSSRSLINCCRRRRVVSASMCPICCVVRPANVPRGSQPIYSSSMRPRDSRVTRTPPCLPPPDDGQSSMCWNIWLVSVDCLTLWRPLLPYGYSYKASCAKLG